MFKNIATKFGAFLVPQAILTGSWVLLTGISALALVISSQPVSATHTSLPSHAIVVKKSIVHPTTPSPTVIQAIAAAPQAAPAPKPVSTPYAPVKKAAQAGTPKPEPVVTPSPNSSVSALTPTTPAPAPPSPRTPSTPPVITTGYTSTNWSGYLAANGTFTGISGSWLATSPAGNSSTVSADSTWIGIGGVTTNDLIQVGTQNIIAPNGRITTSAFYEMLPDYAQTVPGVTVAPGDTMAASLTEISSSQWTITITDKTDGESFTLTVSYTSSLSSAEWIEEDPSYSSGRQIAFDNFQQASFTGGLTVTSSGTFTIATSTAQPVTMIDGSGQPIALPSGIGSGGASFTVTP